MKIYLAGGWKEHKVVSLYARRLESAGFEITYDWTKAAADPNTRFDRELAPIDRTAISNAELDAVAFARFFWLLVPSYDGSKGSWTELGAALACKRYGDVTCPMSIVVSGDYDATIFTFADGVEHRTLLHEDAFKYICDRAK